MWVSGSLPTGTVSSLRISTMKLSRYLPVLLPVLLVACGGGDYTELLTLKGEGYTVKLYSSNGEINVGINRIRVEVDPPDDLEEFYLYMPPMPGMPEMRAIADLKKKGKGRYEGKVSVSMEGSWQVIAKVGGKTLKTEINVPFKAGQQAGTSEGMEGMDHSKMGHGMQGMEGDDMKGMDMGPSLTVPQTKLAHFNVSTFRVDSTEVPLTIRAAGVIRYAPKGTYRVVPRFSGYITKVFVDREGRRVAKGTPLFEFYSPEILRAFGEYEVARKAGDSLALALAAEKLRLYGVSPGDVRDTTAVFRSPVSGKVARVMVSVGKEFRPNTPLYEILSGNLLYFVGEVPQGKARHLKVGDRVVIDGIEARITEISPSVNGRTRTVKFTAVFSGGDFYDGEIRVAEVKRAVRGIFVPLDAVIRTGKRDYVYVREGKNTFTVRYVKVLAPVEGGYVVSGLRPGEEVVASGVFFIDAEANFRGMGGGSHAGH